MFDKKILLIGPLPNPITGESFANQTLVSNLHKYSDSYKFDSINMSYHKLEGLGKLSFAKILFYAKLYKNIFKVLKADVVYITPGQTFFGVVKYAPFIFLARISGKKIIAHIHGNYLHLEYAKASSFKRNIMHFIFSKVDKGIVLSRSLIHNLSPFVEAKDIYILENFVEDILFSKNKILIDKQTDFLRILFLSNLMPKKGIFDLLDALLILQNENIKFTAKFAGAIDSEHKLQIQNGLDKLGSNAEYLGVVKGEDKKDAFEWSNIFVLPSCLIEGQPISILEAMATGNIVLTTHQPAIDDVIISERNGYYIDKNSPESIAEKLRKISTSLQEQKHIMVNNQKIAAEQYRVENFVRNFIKILDS